MHSSKVAVRGSTLLVVVPSPGRSGFISAADLLAVRESMNVYLASGLTIRMDASTTFCGHIPIIRTSRDVGFSTGCDSGQIPIIPVSRDLDARTSRSRSGPALVASSLCPGQEKSTMHEPEAKSEIPVKGCRSSRIRAVTGRDREENPNHECEAEVVC